MINFDSNQIKQFSILNQWVSLVVCFYFIVEKHVPVPEVIFIAATLYLTYTYITFTDLGKSDDITSYSLSGIKDLEWKEFVFLFVLSLSVIAVLRWKL